MLHDTFQKTAADTLLWKQETFPSAQVAGSGEKKTLMSDLERVRHGTQVSTRYSEQGKRKEAKYLTILNVQFVSKALLKKKKVGRGVGATGKRRLE